MHEVCTNINHGVPHGVRTPSDVRKPCGARRSPLEAWALVPPRGVQATGVSRKNDRGEMER